jgi:hypothetical protein
MSERFSTASIMCSNLTRKRDSAIIEAEWIAGLAWPLPTFSPHFTAGAGFYREK